MRYPDFKCQDPRTEAGFIACSIDEACARGEKMEAISIKNFITKFQLWCDDSKYNQVILAED